MQRSHIIVRFEAIKFHNHIFFLRDLPLSLAFSRYPLQAYRYLLAKIPFWYQVYRLYFLNISPVLPLPRAITSHTGHSSKSSFAMPHFSLSQSPVLFQADFSILRTCTIILCLISFNGSYNGLLDSS